MEKESPESWPFAELHESSGNTISAKDKSFKTVLFFPACLQAKSLNLFELAVVC